MRSAAIMALSVMAIGAVAGCQSSSGSAAANPFKPTGGVQSSGGTTSAGTTSGGSTSGDTSGGASTRNWVLSAPNSIAGLARYQPSSSMLQTINTDLQKGTAPLGVTGTPVISVYDDPKHDVYIIVAGVNGSGLDPKKLTAAFSAMPRTDVDGLGDRVTHNYVIIDPGDHGGTAGCASELIQGGSLAGESTICSWMTPTTFGSVSYYPKPDHKMMVVGTGPEVMGLAMRDVRAQVEHQG